MKKALFSGAVVIFFSSLTSVIFAADGFGENATGGAGGAVVTASTATAFRNYVQSDLTYIVQVSGTIDLGGGVSIRSNKTIKGIGTNPTIIGRLGFRDDASNIIIERLNITNPYYNEMDGISVKSRVTNLFITHCTLYDCGDGCIDITEQSDYVTVSWCKFYYTYDSGHDFVNLIGASDTDYGDRGKLHITFHHNWWADLCHERMPRVRFGQVHIYNNYYTCTDNNYCIRLGVEAELFVENNYFYQVDEPIDTKDPSSILECKFNFFNSCTHVYYVQNGPDDAFTPPYSYTPDVVFNVPSIVMSGAGADGADTGPPSAPTGLTSTSGLSVVGLDWDDNSESDFDGYNVYRSTTSGSGYSKLNTSLLSDSNYIDDSTTLDTTFYYVVTAVDTTAEESGYSNEVFGGLYGDFNGNGIVESNDLPGFLVYWLIYDCDGTVYVDLDENCLVDFYEFSVLAENWNL